jgi:hypothetical protein
MSTNTRLTRSAYAERQLNTQGLQAVPFAQNPIAVPRLPRSRPRDAIVPCKGAVFSPLSHSGWHWDMPPMYVYVLGCFRQDCLG